MLSNEELLKLLKITKKTAMRWRKPVRGARYLPLTYTRDLKTGRILYDPDYLIRWVEVNRPKYLEKLQVYLAGVQRGANKY